MSEKLSLVGFIMFSHILTLDKYFDKLEDWEHLLILALTLLCGIIYIKPRKTIEGNNE